MTTEEFQAVRAYVTKHIGEFHAARLHALQNIDLRKVLTRKNPYLFRAKNLSSAPELIESILQAFLSSSEEGIFGNFLEGLAIFVAQLMGTGQKSGIQGIDLELTRDDTRYLIAIKSGKAWGNSTQRKKLKELFEAAIRVIRQNKAVGKLEAVEGICYGNFKEKHTGSHLKIGGQAFWFLISGERDFYLEIVEPLGTDAQAHEDAYASDRDAVFNRLVRDFTIGFCLENGRIDWVKLLKYNSGNLKG